MAGITEIDDLAVPVADFLDGRRRNPDHHLHGYVAARLGVPPAAVRAYRVRRRSVDARDHRRLLLRYRLAVAVDEALPAEDELPLDRLEPRDDLAGPLVVGAGPAGLFAGLLLARHGARPRLLDRRLRP